MKVTSKQIKAILAIGLATSAIGLGSKLAIADRLSNSPSTSTSTAAAVPGKPSTSDTLGAALPNAEAGLSDSQREALHQQGWSNFQQRYESWRSALKLSQLDLRSVPKGSLNAGVLPGQPTLQAAVAKADLIVVGTVSAIQPKSSFGGTDTTFSVEQTLKGPAATSVLFTQSALFFPTPNFKGTTILQAADGALLVPGDRAVLLLQKSTTGGYAIQSISGWYQVSGGVVRSNGYNTWGKSIDGQTEAGFVQLIKAAAGLS